MLFNLMFVNSFALDLCCDSIEESIKQKISHMGHGGENHTDHHSDHHDDHKDHSKDCEDQEHEDHHCHSVCCTSFSAMELSASTLTITLYEFYLNYSPELSQKTKNIIIRLDRPPTQIS